MTDMQIGSNQWRDAIVDGAAQFGIEVSSRQIDLFSQHAADMLEWNRKTNLTAIVDPLEVAIKHYLDAIIPLPHIPIEGHLLDLGTGGGFPGIPLKIMRPEQPMTLIDSSRKKISFVKSIIRQLKLPKAEALHIRSADLARQDDYQGRFDVVVSRAVADLATLVQWVDGLVTPSGRLVVYQGPKEGVVDAPPLDADLSVYRRIQVIPYRLPVLEDRRKVIVIEI